MFDLALVIIPALSFGTIAGIAFLLGHYCATQVRMQQRLPAQSFAPEASDGSGTWEVRSVYRGSFHWESLRI